MMVAMSSMQEEMHQWTGEERKPDQESQHVSPVFGEQQRPGDGQKSDQDQAGLGFDGHALLRALSISGMVLHGNAPMTLRA
jgi:hypothetical protein